MVLNLKIDWNDSDALLATFSRILALFAQWCPPSEQSASNPFFRRSPGTVSFVHV